MFTICYLFSDLDVKVSSFISKGHRHSTSRTYASAQNTYKKFCSLYKLVPFPASESTLLRFVAYLSPTVSHRSIHVYLAAVRSLHIVHGLDPPPTSSPRIALAIKGLASNSAPPKSKSPISFHLLVRILPFVHCDLDSLAVWSCMTLAFFGCLRASEVAPPFPLDGSFPLPSLPQISFGISNGVPYFQFNVTRSKTSAHGFSVIIACSQKPVCAWCALVRYLQLRGITSTSSSTEPLFLLSSGAPISKQYLVARTRSFIQAVGLDPTPYTGHSFRVGAATQASINNMPEFHIQQLGHWKSNAYKSYIHTPISQLISYTHTLSSNSHNSH